MLLEITASLQEHNDKVKVFLERLDGLSSSENVSLEEIQPAVESVLAEFCVSMRETELTIAKHIG